MKGKQNIEISYEQESKTPIQMLTNISLLVHSGKLIHVPAQKNKIIVSEIQLKIRFMVEKTAVAHKLTI